jgi:hypothetical protein
MQGGETAMQQIHETMKRLITAMSLSVKKVTDVFENGVLRQMTDQ